MELNLERPRSTRPVDLLRKLNENHPQVVHFSSHGSPDEIMLESGDEDAEVLGPGGPSLRSADERDMKKVRPDEVESEGLGHGQAQVVSKSALVNVLRSCNEGNLRLVVLNACNTRPQAEALTEIVDCVVSMNRTITDRAAIKFAASFYGALAFGRSVQKAFDQGVARLGAEGIAESDTPELLVRAGVDASQVTLVGRARTEVTGAAAEAPFIVPFPRNPDFVGRDGDLARLHTTLTGPGSGPVGIRPAGLTGMGGIGKTQLVVEYVYRHRDDYPDGVFWIDAAGPLVEGFARLATDHRLMWAENEQPRDVQIRAAFKALNGRPHALLVLDNLADPAAIALHLLAGLRPGGGSPLPRAVHDAAARSGADLQASRSRCCPRNQLCGSCCGTRRASRPWLRPRADPRACPRNHPDAGPTAPGGSSWPGHIWESTVVTCRCEDYREGLTSDGARLATLDADAAELNEADLRRVHDPAVAATSIGEQWRARTGTSPARLLLLGSRACSRNHPRSRLPALSLLAGLADLSAAGTAFAVTPVPRVKRLDDACLVDRLEADQASASTALIREFAAGQNLARRG